MENEVSYSLTLKDLLTSKLKEADHAAEKLHHTIHGVGERLAHVAEAFGISFALFKGIEFMHEGVEEFEKLHKAEAQLENTMMNMGKYSTESFEEAVLGAKKLASHLDYTQAEFLQLQSQLGLIGSIGEEQIARLGQASADMAAKFGMGLTEAGEMLGKAINAPEMARRLAMRLKIDPSVMKNITELAKTGHEAEARMRLIEIAERKVGGAAQAAFDANPLSRYNKAMMEIKLEVGELAAKVLKHLGPILENLIKIVKEVIHWTREHKEILQDVAIGVMAGAAAWGVFSIATNISTAATWAMTIATRALNFVLSISPLGWIAIAIGVVTTAVIYCYNHFQTFRAVLWSVWAVIKEFGSLVGDIFMGVYHVIHGAFKLNLNEVTEGIMSATTAVANAGFRLGKAAKDGYAAGLADFAKDAAPKSIAAPHKIGNGKDGRLKDMPSTQAETKGAKGQKNTTINIKIGSLINGGMTFQTKNIHESMSKIKEAVTQTMLSAVNDSQMVTGS